MSEKNNKKNTVAAPVDGVAVIAEPEVVAVVEPVVQTDASVPSATIEKTVEVPLVAPTAIVPNLVYEQTTEATDGTTDAPVFDVEKAGSKKVRVICEGSLGLKMLKKGDITDDPEYVALLDTERGRQLVEKFR